MKELTRSLALLILLPSLATGFAQNAQTGSPAPSHKKSAAPKTAQPSVEDQIRSLREQMQEQIDQLKQQLSDRDRQLQSAQQSAAEAQQAAQQAEAAAAQNAQTVTETTQQVNKLQGAVGALQTSNTTLTATVRTQQKQVHEALAIPDLIRYKGVTLSPLGSFLAGETAWRQRATGGGINTPFTSIPLADQSQYYYSEFYGSGRQSRIALLASGALDNMTIRGYYEADFLGTGITSNNNQSNSYALRQRQVWAQAALDNGWTFTGGQMWSLATENLSGIQNITEGVPLSIDPAYTPGFVWTRQYGFRVTKSFSNRLFIGAAAENPQTPSVVGQGIPDNFLVGQAGNGGGLYNPTANYSSNVAPDMLAKVVLEPGWGHYELFGIARFFRARVYPNAVYKTVGSTTTVSGSSAGAYNDTTTGGGIGGSFRVPTFAKHLDVGLKGLWGDGIGRYGDSQIADTTVRPDGQLALVHGFSALSTLEYHPTPRMNIYANYGGDYAGRKYFITGPGKSVGYGSPYDVESGCATEAVPGTGTPGYSPGSSSKCTADTRYVTSLMLGYWYDFYRGPGGRLRQGIQYSLMDRSIWSGASTVPTTADNMFWTSFRYYLP